MNRNCLTYKAQIFVILSSAFLLSLAGNASGESVENINPEWKHFYIANPLPGEDWGTAGPAVGDFDGDGDLDVAFSRRSVNSAYWYEYVNDSTWVSHLMSVNKDLERALGSAVIDINRDGHPDVVIKNIIFLNPGNLPQDKGALWPTRTYEGGGHDIVAANIDTLGGEELVTYHGEDVLLFDPDSDMKKYVVGRGESNHGGVAPSGIGDLNGDGFPDIVIPGYWFENPGTLTPDWRRHEWPHEPIENATYGTSIRSFIADLDKDGDNDIIYGDCDTGLSHVYWVENKGIGVLWERHKLDDPPTAPGDVPGTGSFHSVAVADFDENGYLDVFAGEQEDSTMNGREPLLSMKPKGLKERGVLWLNAGGTPPVFSQQLVHIDNPGWHDVLAVDVDGDGDYDLVTKIWNKDGDAYTASYWRNDMKKKGKP